MVGDIKDALTRLNAMMAKRPLNKKHTAWLEQIAEWKQKGPFAYSITQEIADSDHMKDHLKGHEDQIILQQMVVEALYELTKGEAIITTGVGQHQMWAGQWYKYKYPRQFITSGGLGSMGFGYPAALGIKVAHPDKEVIDIDGDGSFLMNIQELATAHVEKINAKAIILNNQHLGMVVQWEDKFYAGNRGHTYLGDPDKRAADLSRLRARLQQFQREMRARDVQEGLAPRHPADARRQGTVCARRDRALYRTRAAVHSGEPHGGGHDLEGVNPARGRL